MPVCEQRAQQVLTAVAAAETAADLIEVRLDCVSELEIADPRALIVSVLRETQLPLIFTLRPREQGGQQRISDALRREFWRNLPDGDFLIDLELDLAEAQDIELDWTRLICSQHDFAGVPDNIDVLYERMAATRAPVLKIAVQANDVTDCLPVFRILERAQTEGRETIAIAMGEAGLATRVLGPSRGSFLTYAPLRSEDATAPGQITAHDLRELYRVDSITRQTMITGLVGLPVAHSVSPHMHNAAFAVDKVDGVYLPFAVHDVRQFMERMVKPATCEIDWNLRGLSITAPYKSEVLQWLDWMDPSVEAIGAANTIVIDSGRLLGYNTDAAAFIKPITQRRASLADLNCAVLGAGGGARTAVWALLLEGAKVTLFARDATRGALLAKRFDVELRNLPAATFAGFDVVVNATPLGTAGSLESEAIVTSRELLGAGLVYDLVYNPVETTLLREAVAANCETIGGLEMLIGQAAAQYQLWTGREAPIAVMKQAAQARLGY